MPTRYVDHRFIGFVGRYAADVCPRIESASLWPVFSTFNENLRRVAHLASMPMIIASHSIHEHWLFAELKRITREFGESTDPNRLEILEQKKAELEKAKANRRGWTDQTSSDFVDRCCDEDPEVALGIAAALGSIILGSWTAVEVLMADLWVAAIDARPRGPCVSQRGV